MSAIKIPLENAGAPSKLVVTIEGNGGFDYYIQHNRNDLNPIIQVISEVLNNNKDKDVGRYIIDANNIKIAFTSPQQEGVKYRVIIF